ncbi:hypothetical protein HRbin39_01389 [bacterium HR39]|nr:hypothetical protein HRbin39_01389 [bacterium HR39]
MVTLRIAAQLELEETRSVDADHLFERHRSPVRRPFGGGEVGSRQGIVQSHGVAQGDLRLRSRVAQHGGRIHPGMLGHEPPVDAEQPPAQCGEGVHAGGAAGGIGEGPLELGGGEGGDQPRHAAPLGPRGELHPECAGVVEDGGRFVTLAGHCRRPSERFAQLGDGLRRRQAGALVEPFGCEQVRGGAGCRSVRAFHFDEGEGLTGPVDGDGAEVEGDAEAHRSGAEPDSADAQERRVHDSISERPRR